MSTDGTALIQTFAATVTARRASMSDNKTASESITLRSVALGTVLAFGFLMKGEGLKN